MDICSVFARKFDENVDIDIINEICKSLVLLIRYDENSSRRDK